MTGAHIPSLTGESNRAADKQVVETFAESFVTVAGKGVVSGESLKYDKTGTTAEETSESGTSTFSVEYGVKINPNVDLAGVQLSIRGNTTGYTKARLWEVSTETLIDSVSLGGGGGETVDLHGDLVSGTTYAAGVTAEGADYTYAYYGSPSWPYTSTDVDIPEGYSKSEGGTIDSDTTNFRAVDGVTAILPSGSATVSFDPPNDLLGWDIASFGETENGDSDVAVYVEDSGGTEIAGPIHPGDSIPAETDDNPQFRLDYTLGSGGEVPKIDHLVRRWKL